VKKAYIIVILVFVVLILAGLGINYYVFHQKHKNTFDLKAEYKLTADNLFKEFEADETKANSKYLGKIIEIEGKIIGIKEFSGSYQISFIDEVFGVTCMVDSNYAIQQKEELLKLKPGDTVKIKGQCNGYLSDVKLDRCVLETNKP
jgi:hypothetical protein